MTWYHPALAQRALDEGDKEIARLKAHNDALVKVLEEIAAENNLDPSSACKIARDALASLVGRAP